MFNSNIGPGYLPRHLFTSNSGEHCIAWYTKPDLSSKLTKHLSSSQPFKDNFKLKDEIENLLKQDNYPEAYALALQNVVSKKDRANFEKNFAATTCINVKHPFPAVINGNIDTDKLVRLKRRIAIADAEPLTQWIDNEFEKDFELHNKSALLDTLDADDINKILKSLPPSKMTVAQFLQTPYNTIYLPYVSTTQYFNPGETWLPVCKRCIRPFYEMSHNVYFYGSFSDSGKINEYLQDKPLTILKNLKARGEPTLAQERKNAKGAQEVCAKSHSQELIEKLKSKFGNIPYRMTFDENGKYIGALDITINKRLYDKMPSELYFDPLVQEGAKTVWTAEVNVHNPDSDSDAPKGYKLKIPQGFIHRSNIHLKKGATDEYQYNAENGQPAFCENLMLERSGFGNLCKDCHKHLGKRAHMNLIESQYSARTLKMPAKLKPEKVDGFGSGKEFEYADEEGKRVQNISSQGTPVDPFKDLALEGGTAFEKEMECCNNFKTEEPDRWQELVDDFKSEKKAEQYLKKLAAMPADKLLKLIDEESDPMKGIEQDFFLNRRYEENERILGEQNAAENMADGQDAEQDTEEQHVPMTKLRPIHIEFLAHTARYNGVAQVMQEHDHKIKQLQHLQEALDREDDKAAIDIIKSVMTADHIKLVEDRLQYHKRVLLGQGEVQHMKFDRHKLRKEIVTQTTRTIKDRELWRQLQGTTDQTITDAVTLANDRETVIFNYEAAGLDTLPQTVVDAHSTTQYRPMTMSHMMITYVMHHRAVGTSHNKVVMAQMGKAVERLFTHHLHTLIDFGYTIDAKTKELKLITVRKADNYNNYTQTYPYDNYITHMCYAEFEAGIEIAPVTKFFHFHLMLKMVHYSKLMFNYMKMKNWLERAFKGNHDDSADNFYIPDHDGSTFFKITDNPYVHIKLHAQDDWDDVLKAYMLKSADVESQYTDVSVRSRAN